MANKSIEPVHNNAACEAVLDGTREGTLVMCLDNVPYAVPINHAFVGGKFYFHCGLRGRKIDLINQNPNVVYVVNKFHGTEAPDEKGRCHGQWESLIAYGTARVLSDDLEAKAAAFRAFMSWYGRPDYEMNEQARDETAAIVIDVTSMTVRSEMVRRQPEYWLWLPEE
jgi:nitroimidazol reductase NimA-like FMN-containing flavoprotein (pyridoxamine 5'-phosphate oxidase superfamily)